MYLSKRFLDSKDNTLTSKDVRRMVIFRISLIEGWSFELESYLSTVWHTDKSTTGWWKVDVVGEPTFGRKDGSVNNFFTNFWLSKIFAKISNLIFKIWSPETNRNMAGKIKVSQTRFLCYPNRPRTLPIGLEHVFQFQNARKSPKTGAKPSVQTHQELEQPGFKQGKEPSSDTTCRSLFVGGWRTSNLVILTH